MLRACGLGVRAPGGPARGTLGGHGGRCRVHAGTPKSELELFARALAVPRSGLEAWLDEQCGTDGGLRHKVVALLDAHERADDAETTAHTDDSAVHYPLMPEFIGPYRVIGRLGEGGMGMVFAAEQTEPVRRRVAIKLVRSNAESQEVLARFEAERQALALMNHPHIAQILDAGEHEGRPYFVMEHIAGLPITEYCDHRALGIRLRLELFVLVCRAVQHAHQKGVIHRDLKPTNVLVTESDGEAVPKVIDFGIAKAVSTKLAEATIHTAYGQIIGTPDYMSPEQADITPLDVDTRSDVYSLGVLLYELLAGVTPLGLFARHAGIDEVRRSLRQDRPARPSTRYGEAGAPARARARSATPEEIAKLLRQDLDWIVLRAMDPDRTRRYASASELGNDVLRYLAGEPVVARPPSTSYRVSKFVRKRRVELAIAGLVLALILTIGIGGALMAVRERSASRRASEEMTRFEALSDFMQNIFLSIDPAMAKGEDTTLLMKLMSEAESRVDTELADYPSAAASMWYTFGSAYFRIAEFDRALTAFERSRTLCDRVGMANESERSLLAIGTTYVSQSRLEDAAAAFTELVDLRTERLGSEDPETLKGVHGLSSVLHRLGRYDEAQAAAQRAYDGWSRAKGAEHPDTLLALMTLTAIRVAQEDYEGAKTLSERVVAGQVAALGAEHPNTLTAMSTHAHILTELGEHDAAAETLARVVEVDRRILPDGHPNLLTALVNLARAQQAGGELGRAEATLADAERVWIKRGEPHDYLFGALRNMQGEVLREQGRHDEAAAAFRGAYLAFREILGIQHETTQRMGRNAANESLAQGDSVSARGLAQALLEADLDRTDPRMVRAAVLECRSRAAGGDVDAALRDLRMMREQVGEGSPAAVREEIARAIEELSK